LLTFRHMSSLGDAAVGPRATLLDRALVRRECPVCGSTDDRRVFAEASFAANALDEFAFSSRKLPEYMHCRIVSCERCDLLYASPGPTREFLEAAYREAAFDASDESRFASVTYGRLVRKFVGSFPDRQGALDIGTGDGAFLHQLRELGFVDVVGVEPSSAPIALAAAEVKPFIRQAPFLASDFESSRFCLITCFQTMEHVHDPLGLCRDAHRLLRERGALILVCHNHRAISARLMGLKSPIFDVEHLQLFSPKSIRAALERAGFGEVHVHAIVNRYPFYYWIKLAPLPKAVKTKLLRSLRGSPLGRMPVSIPVGNMAVIGYKR
jgi:SAM-dependent methyltransferase